MIYCTKLTSHQAVSFDVRLNIPTLDAISHPIHISELIHSEYSYTIPDKGLPIDGILSKRGDLYVHFNIKYPVAFDKIQKSLAKDFLSGVTKQEKEKKKHDKGNKKQWKWKYDSLKLLVC